MTFEPTHLTEIRTSYDTVAEAYAPIVREAFDRAPEERTLLADVAAEMRGRVLDAGCGPGHVTAFLRSLGADAFGVDLSPGMIAVARRDHPGIEFAVGSMTELDVDDGTLGGVVAWWSIIHLPTDQVPVALAEFHRVLGPGGLVALGFHVGDERRRKREGYGGLPMALDVQHWRPDELGRLLAQAGFKVTRRHVSDDRVPQAVLVARKPYA